jgi:hypothetical protein
MWATLRSPACRFTYLSQIGWFPVFCFELSSLELPSCLFSRFRRLRRSLVSLWLLECSMEIVEVNRVRKQSDRKNRGESSRNIDGSDEASRCCLVR